MRNLIWMLCDPRALSRLVIQQPIGLALFVLAAAQASTSIARLLATTGHGATFAMLDTILSGTLSLVAVFVGTAFFHLFATLMGGRGSPAQLFWGLMVGNAPWMLATPGVLLALGLGSRMPEAYPMLLLAGATALCMWAIGLKSYVIARLYGLSGAGGLFVLFVGYGTVLILAGISAFCLWMSGVGWIVFLAAA